MHPPFPRFVSSHKKEVLSTRIRAFLISSNQTAYVKNQFISKSGGVISDILEISNTLALEGFFSHSR